MNTSIFSRYTIYLAAIIALSITFSSCEKEDEKPEPICLVQRQSRSGGLYTEYEYNAEGLLKKEMDYRPDSTLGIRHEYEYNTQQKIAKDNWYTYFSNPNEPAASQVVYEYDALGRVSKILSYQPDGRVAITYEYTYTGNTQTIKTLDFLGRLSSQTVNEYQDGYIVKFSRIHFKSGDQFITTYTYHTDKVDKAGAQNPRDPSVRGKYLPQQSKTLYIIPSGDSTTIVNYSYEFDTKGYLIRSVSQSTSWSFIYTTVYEYNCQ